MDKNKEINTETEDLLSRQKVVLNDLDKQHQLLLGSSQNDQYSELKRSLGWDDTDRVINAEYSKVLELKELTEKNIDSKIFNDETIWNYCIDNNYVLARINDYKGQIPEELLKAIDEYSRANDIRLNSDANLQQLYILCRFTDLKGNNNSNITKSKRYKKDNLPKIMLFEKCLKGNAYNNDFYKLIFEMGYKTPIQNLVNSLFFTHTRTINFFNNWSLYSGVLFLSILISGIIISLMSKFDVENITYLFFWESFLVNVILLILTSKIFIPQVFVAHDGDASFNLWIDSNFKEVLAYPNSTNETRIKKGTRWCNTSYIYQYCKIGILDKMKVRLRVYAGCLIMVLASFLLFKGMIHVNRMIVLEKHGTLVSVKTNLEKTLETTTIYKQTSPFNYEEYVSVKDISPEAIRKNAYERMVKNIKEKFGKTKKK